MVNYRSVYGLGAVLLGVVGVLVGDFALQWQPVPAGMPLRQPLAYVSALLLIGGGIALLIRRSAKIAAVALAIWYGLWVVLLHAPRVLAHPLDLSIWLGVGEISALALGGLAAWLLQTNTQPRVPAFRMVQIAFGLCLLIFGASHVVYADFSASMIPSWLPLPLFWVYLTGAGHIAAGASFISGIATRAASLWFVVMLASFVLLLHLPRVVADPGNRIEWTMLGIATSLTGAACILRAAAIRR